MAVALVGCWLRRPRNLALPDRLAWGLAFARLFAIANWLARHIACTQRLAFPGLTLRRRRRWLARQFRRQTGERIGRQPRWARRGRRRRRMRLGFRLPCGGFPGNRWCGSTLWTRGRYVRGFRLQG